MKKILIPTDFSENAYQAARYALRLFGNSADYTLVNAYQVPHSGSTMLISIADILKRDSEQLLREQIIRLEDDFPSLVDHLSAVAEMGQADTVLRKIISNNGADMVVMGTKGATGLRSVLVGSVASNVMQNVSCAVMAIPSETVSERPSRIVFAADDTTLQHDHCPEVLAYVAQRSDATVLILNVVKDGSRMADAGAGKVPMNAFDGVPHEFHFRSGEDIGESVIGFAKEHGAHMVAMVRRRKDLVSNLFGLSKTREMIQAAKLPMLILPNDRPTQQ